jgi:mono/diheme cytochrome c family protein
MRVLLLTGLLALLSCGQERESVRIVEVEVPEDPGPGPDPVDPPGTSWAEFRGLFDRNCASCHRNDPFAESEASMRDPRNRVEALIRGRQMPPNSNAMSESDRAKMLNFF